MTSVQLALKDAHDRAFSINSHYMPSSNYSTKTVLVLFRALLDTVSRMVKDGDPAVSGVDPSGLDAKLRAWTEGTAARMGDRLFCAVLLGALRRAVETLEQHTGINPDEETT